MVGTASAMVPGVAPKIPSPPPQAISQDIVHQQYSAVPGAGYHYNCPQCGANIDITSGQCTNCGALIGKKLFQEVPQQPSPAMPTGGSVVLPPQPQDVREQQFTLAADASVQNKCPHCGANVHVDSRVCPYCGKRCGTGRRYSRTQGQKARALWTTGGTAQVAASVPSSVSIPMSAVSYPAPSEQSMPLPRSPLLDEIGGAGSGAGSRGLGIPSPAKRFPMGVLLIIFLLVVGIIAVGYVIGQNVINWNQSPPQPTLTISNALVSSITEASAVVTWKTDNPATSRVMACDPGGVCTWTDAEGTLVTDHSVTLTDLEPGTNYHLTLISKDESENEATIEKELATLAESDAIPPVISGVGVSNITEASAVIEWTTDEEATSQVEYGASDDYGSTTSLDEELTTSHSVTLTGLESGTTYHFRVKSKDVSDNEIMSETDETFQTLVPVPVGTEIGNRAPGFTLENPAGEEVSLSDFRGKIVMVNFWATWCGPCVAEMPYLQAVRNSWSSDDLIILAINVAESATEVQSFMDSKGYTFTALLDVDSAVVRDYPPPPPASSTTIPKTFFIDAEGIVQSVEVGRFHSQDEIENILDSL